MGGTFEAAFGSKGIVYKAGESMTSKGKWADEYENGTRAGKCRLNSISLLERVGRTPAFASTSMLMMRMISS
jgi:hypothetical protein